MQWTKESFSNPYGAIQGMDPRAEWLLGPGIADFLPEGPDQPFPFMLHIDNEKTATYLNRTLSARTNLFMPQFWPGEPRTLSAGDHIGAFATKDFFDEMARSAPELAQGLRQRIQFSLPMSNTASRLGWRPGEVAPQVQEPVPGYGSGEWAPDKVIVAVIDDGIGFAHERFRIGPGETRIEFFWHQDGMAPPQSSAPFGREFGKAEINALLQAASSGGEDEIYRKAGMLDFRVPGHKPLGLRLAHGTHVLDLAAGEDPAQRRRNRPIIAVQLASVATENASGANIEFYVEAALTYIRTRAKLLAGKGPPLPVVVNFSYATQTGPHDGTARLEEFIDRIVRLKDPPMRVVAPAGNGHAARCHAEADFSTSALVELPWRVQPDDLTPTVAEIWMPHADGSPPAGQPHGCLARHAIGFGKPAAERGAWLLDRVGQRRRDGRLRALHLRPGPDRPRRVHGDVAANSKVAPRCSRPSGFRDRAARPVAHQAA